LGSAEISVPCDLGDSSPHNAGSPIVNLDDIDPVVSEGVSPTERSVISHESPSDRDEVIMFLIGNRADCWKS
jgi:hypothetical protein